MARPQHTNIVGYNAISTYLGTAPSGATLYVDKSRAGRNRRIGELVASANRHDVPVREVSAQEILHLAGDSAAAGPGGQVSGALLVFLPAEPPPETLKRRDDPGRSGSRRDGYGAESSESSLDPVNDDAIGAYLRRAGRPRSGTAAQIVVILDGITDPHNFGAILRSADLFSVDLVVVPSRHSARETDTVARTSAGAAAYVPTAVVTNLSRTIERFKKSGYWVYGADMAGTEVSSRKFSGKVVLVLGSEGSGLSRLVRESCDALVAIPTSGHIDSLNVSVSAGILLYEIRRQTGY